MSGLVGMAEGGTRTIISCKTARVQCAPLKFSFVSYRPGEIGLRFSSYAVKGWILWKTREDDLRSDGQHLVSRSRGRDGIRLLPGIDEKLLMVHSCETSGP